MLPTNIFKSHPKDRKLLIVDYQSTQTKLAYFHDDNGELIFGGSSTGERPLAAWQTLSNRPDKVTDLVMGVPFDSLADLSTVVRYRRSSPQSKITDDEVKNALAQVQPIDGEEIFFEDLFNAKVDGLPTLEPVERMGEVVELNLYQVSCAKDHLHSLIAQVRDLGSKPGLVPTSYAIAKLISQTSPKGALVIKITPNQTEISLSAEGHLVGLKSFDVGGAQRDLFTTALEAAIEDLEYDELWPETVYLCGTIENYEEIRSDLLAFPWTKKVNMINFPKVEVFHPLSVNLTLPSDVGLNALSLLG